LSFLPCLLLVIPAQITWHKQFTLDTSNSGSLSPPFDGWNISGSNHFQSVSKNTLGRDAIRPVIHYSAAYRCSRNSWKIVKISCIMKFLSRWSTILTLLYYLTCNIQNISNLSKNNTTDNTPFHERVIIQAS